MNLFTWIPAVIYSTIVIGGLVTITVIFVLNTNFTDTKDILLILVGHLTGMGSAMFGKWMATIYPDSNKKDIE